MEPKRLELMTVGPVNEEKEGKKRIPTFRFNLTLTESTDRICPEFSYTELIKNALVSNNFYVIYSIDINISITFEGGILLKMSLLLIPYFKSVS